MKHGKACLIFSLLLCPITVSAFSLVNTTITPVATVSAGAIFLGSVGSSVSFPIVDPSSDSFYNYYARHWNQSKFIYGVFLGADFSLVPCWDLQLGLSYYHPSIFYSKGSVRQGADPVSANTFSYRYSVSSHQLMVEGKLLANYNPRFHPYLSLGLGAAFNDVYDYQVAIVPPFITFSNQFPNHRTTSFTYIVGVGADVDIAQNWRAGLGYRFTNLGKTQTGNASINNVPTGNQLTQNNIYGNEALAQLTYIWS